VLKNNIKILLVSFVHYIELQNFLIAPRMHPFVWVDWCTWRLDFHLQMNVHLRSIRAWTLTLMKNLLFFTQVSPVDMYFIHSAGPSSLLELYNFFTYYLYFLCIIWLTAVK